MTDGVIYIATAPDFLTQAKVSANSLRDHNSTNIALITSNDLKEEVCEGKIFNDIITVNSTNIYDDVRDKSNLIVESPYDKTLYIDTDTYILGDLSPVFELLDKFDFVASHAQFRRVVTVSGIPESFPEFNGGVIGFKNNENVTDLIDAWKNLLQKQHQEGRPDEKVLLSNVDSMDDLAFGRLHDQPPLREAIYKSEIQFYTLPPEYNFRGSGWASNEIKILHMGHDETASKLKKILNSQTGGRVHVSQRGVVYFQDGTSVFMIGILHRVINKIASSRKLRDRLKCWDVYRYSEKLYNKIT